MRVSPCVLLSETLAKLFFFLVFFSLRTEAKAQEAACLQDKWLEAFPCWFSRQTVDDRGERLVLNHRAVCSETQQQTEAFSG